MKRRWKLPLLILSLLMIGLTGGLGAAYLQADEAVVEPILSSQVASAEDNARDDTHNESVVPVQPQQLELTIENLVKLTNEQRAKAGLQPLVNSPVLNASAKAKADDMASRNYWGHDTPDGKKPWDFIIAQGMTYTFAGENLGCGFNDAKEQLVGWMNSPTHKANIVKAEYTHVGFAIVPQAYNYMCGNYKPPTPNIVVQHFATPY